MNLPAERARQVQAADEVRYVGEPIAVVMVAESPDTAADAVEAMALSLVGCSPTSSGTGRPAR